jgi:hypothetical protein
VSEQRSPRRVGRRVPAQDATWRSRQGSG